jgi:hypothetical protein
MSVAAQEACLLRRLLERLAEDSDPIAGLAPALFAEVPALLDTPWSVATFDFINPNARGQRPADFETRLKFAMAYGQKTETAQTGVLWRPQVPFMFSSWPVDSNPSTKPLNG